MNMKDYKSELRKNLQAPLLTQFPHESIKSLPMSANVDEFLKKFYEYTRKEIWLSSMDDLLSNLIMDYEIEKFYKILLIDYQTSYEKLQRPFLKAEYFRFVKEKEEPLKLFFQYLKEHMHKCLTSSELTSLDLLFITKKYDEFSFYDILSNTFDFSLRYNILWVVYKMTNSSFFEKLPSTIANTHYSLFYEFTFLHSDKNHLQWVEFNQTENLSFLSFKPTYIILINPSQSKIVPKDFKNTENEDKILIDFEETYEKYLKNTQNEKEEIIPHPSDYLEFVLKIIKEKNPKLEITSQMSEEIKLIFYFNYMKDFEQRTMSNDVTEKNDLFYFFLNCYLCHELMKQNKLTIFKNTFFKSKEFTSKFSPNLHLKFFREFPLLANVQTAKEKYFIDYLFLISTYSYNDIFNDSEYKKKIHYGKVEESVLKVFLDEDLFGSDESNFDYFTHYNVFTYMKNHFKNFSISVEKFKLITEKEVENQTLQKILDSSVIILDSFLKKIEINADKGIFFKKFTTLYIIHIIKGNLLSDRTPVLFDVLIKTFDYLLKISEESPLNYGDDFFSFEKLLLQFFSCFDSNYLVNKRQVCEHFLNQNYLKRFEEIIIEKKHPFPLMCYKRVMGEYYTLDNEITAVRNLITKQSLYDHYLALYEVCVLEMQNLTYDLIYIFSKVIHPSKLSDLDQKNRLMNCALERFYLQKTNRSGYGNYNDGSIKNYSHQEIYDFFENMMNKNLDNLQKQTNIANELLFHFKNNDPEHFEIIKKYYDDFFSILCFEQIKTFSTLRMEYGFDNFPINYTELNTKYVLEYYCHSFSHIMKPYANNAIGVSLTNFASSFISMKDDTLPGHSLKLLIVYYIELANKQIDLVFKNILDFSKENNKRLFTQYYVRGFFAMDEDLINQENFEKCKEIKKLEFLFSYIKKFNKRNRGVDIYKMRPLIDEYLNVILNKVIEFYSEALDVYLYDLVERTFKMDEAISLSSYMTISSENLADFGDISTLKPSRLLKNIFLFIKSFGYYKDYTNLKPHLAQALNEIFTKYFPKLEINEKIINIEKLFSSKENYQTLLVNVIKQKYFLKLCLFYKQISDPNPKPIILFKIDNFEVINVAGENIHFFLKFYAFLRKSCKLNPQNINKIVTEIISVLKDLYFKYIFCNYTINDFNLYSTFSYQVGYFEHLTKNIDKILDFFEINFAIPHIFPSNTENNDFVSVFRQLKVENFAKFLFDDYSNIIKIEEIDDISLQPKYYKSFIIFSITKKIFKNSLMNFFSKYKPPKYSEKYSDLQDLCNHICKKKQAELYVLNEDLIKNLFLLSAKFGFQIKNFLVQIIELLSKLIGFSFETPTSNDYNESFFLEIKEIIPTSSENDIKFKMDIAYLILFLLDNYKNSANEVNLSKTSLFQVIYSQKNDDRNHLVMEFYFALAQILETHAKEDIKQKYLQNICKMITDDLIDKTKYFNPDQDKDIFINDGKIFFKFLKIFENAIINTSSVNSFKELIAVIFNFVYYHPELKEAFYELNVLKSLMRIKSTASYRLNENEYMETFYKLLEFLYFDKEFVYTKISQEILDLFFYEENTQSFQLNVEFSVFETKMTDYYKRYPEIFAEVMNNFCEVKKEDKIMIYLKKEIIDDPDIFRLRQYHLEEKNVRLIQQLGQDIIEQFLEEVDNSLRPVQFNYIFSTEYLMKFLIFLRNEYPMIFQILGNIPIELSEKAQKIYENFQFPPQKKSADFNYYFYTVIVGLSFGIHNVYINDFNVSKKLSMGLVRLEDKIVKKKIIYICEVIVETIENIAYYTNVDLKNSFSSSLILWNYSNFLSNLLSKLNYFSRTNPNFKDYYEEYLKRSVWVFCEIIRKADPEKLLILQALEIPDRIAIFYKLHMRFIYKKRAMALGKDEKFEMNAKKTKYFFQKHLKSFFENPQQIKENLSFLREKKSLKPLFLNDTSLNLIEKIQKYHKQSLFRSSHEFFNKTPYKTWNVCFENHSFVFGGLIHNRHKVHTCNKAIPSLTSLFDSNKWVSDTDRKAWTNFYNKLAGDYDRFRNGNNVKYMTQNYLYDTMKPLNFIYLDKAHEELQNLVNLKTINEFVKEMIKENSCENLIPNKENEQTLNQEIQPKRRGSIKAIPQPPQISPEEKKENPQPEDFFVDNTKPGEEQKIEEANIFNEPNEEKPANIEDKDNLYQLTEKDYKFLEKFYFLLGIDENEFLSSSQEIQINLLKKKYNQYLGEFFNKYINSLSSDVVLKNTRESLGLLMCEKYLVSEEDQYMFHEIQELKFFLNTLKKNSIEVNSFYNDEMVEQTIDLLKKDDFSFETEIPLNKLIGFDTVQLKEKERFIIFNEDFVKNPKNICPDSKKPSDFYNFDAEEDIKKIYTLDFFNETLEIDEEIIEKLFSMISYSVPKHDVIKSVLSSNFQNNFSNHSTYLLLKILCFNYRNFFKIVNILDFSLDKENYLELNKKHYLVESPRFIDGTILPSIESYYSYNHACISAIVTSLIKNNYGSIFFLLLDKNNEHQKIFTEILSLLQVRKINETRNSSILRKIFSFYEESDKTKFESEFEILKTITNFINFKTIVNDEVPNEKIKENMDEDPLYFYPFFKLDKIPDWPDNKRLINWLLCNSMTLSKSKIQMQKDGFYKLIAKSSATNLISQLIPNALPDFLTILIKDFEHLHNSLIKIKEKLIEDINNKSIKYSTLSNAISNINNNFSTLFPKFSNTSKDFTVFLQNIIKISKKSLENLASVLTVAYTKSITKTTKDFEDLKEKFEEYEKDLLEMLRFFLIKDKNFNYLFLMVIKVLLTLEELTKLIPNITNSQKNSTFEIIVKFTNIIKTYFRAITFLELKELNLKKTPHDIDFLTNNMNLPAMKRIFTKDNSNYESPLILEKSISSVVKNEVFNFDDVFNLIYKVQDIMHLIFIKINGRSPSIYKIFFYKTELNKISLFCKMEYLKKETLYRCQKYDSYNDDGEENELTINRKNVFDSTYEILKKIPPKQLAQSNFKINFDGESGIDGGGLRREWVSLLGQQMFDPEKGLFVFSSNKLAVQPNPFSFIVPNHLNYYQFIGNLIGRFMLDYSFDPLGVTFTKHFLKLLLNKNLNINDFEDIDPAVCKNLQWILENDITELEQRFCYYIKFFDKTLCIDLIENGRNILVTESNKKDYVKSFCLAKMNKEIRTQTHTLMKGILEIIPYDLISLLNENELGLAMSGFTTIDVSDMKNYVNLASGYTKDDKVINWLFEILEEYTDSQKASFHFFITGSFRPPFGGFKNNPITLTKLTNVYKLPIAHTCSRNMELPNYTSKEILQEKLELAIFDGCSSYEFG